jgi:SAM-dependent methyltransferase
MKRYSAGRVPGRSATLGQVFADADVARAYRQRAPYPEETFAILEELLVGPPTVLDAGAGTGLLARGMLRFATRVDALDPSIAMIDEGRRMPGGDDPRLRWIVGTAEEGALDPPYGLITAGSSIHWIDADRAMPRFAAALAPGAHLAILETDDGEHPLPDVIDIIKRYSELGHHAESLELLAALEATGRFEREGERRTAPVALRRGVEEYLEFLHSTSTLARVRLGERAARFDEEIRELFARHGMTSIERQIVGVVVWGRPR